MFHDALWKQADEAYRLCAESWRDGTHSISHLWKLSVFLKEHQAFLDYVVEDLERTERHLRRSSGIIIVSEITEHEHHCWPGTRIETSRSRTS
jgi:hypothetical protein